MRALVAAPQGDACPDLLTRLCGDQAVVTAHGSWQQIEPRVMDYGMRRGDVQLISLRDMIYVPSKGLLMDSKGRVPPAFLEVLHQSPRLLKEVDRLLQKGRAGLPRVDKAAVWQGGGSANYGHFLLDDMAGLAWMQSSGLTQAMPPINAPLTAWQQGLLQVVGLTGGTAHGGAVWIDQAVITTTNGHYLQRSGRLHTELFARIARPETPGDEVVYLSRAGLTGRVLINETQLQRDLQARGARILHPQRMSVAEQQAAIGAARVLISPSGAALANAVFLAPGARLIEIRPGSVQEFWMGLLTENLRLDHRVVQASNPLAANQIPLRTRLQQLPRRLLRRYHVAYDVDIEKVLAEV